MRVVDDKAFIFRPRPEPLVQRRRAFRCGSVEIMLHFAQRGITLIRSHHLAERLKFVFEDVQREAQSNDPFPLVVLALYSHKQDGIRPFLTNDIVVLSESFCRLNACTAPEGPTSGLSYARGTTHRRWLEQAKTAKSCDSHSQGISRRSFALRYARSLQKIVARCNIVEYEQSH